MRMLKKFLLAASLIGLLGTFGFASDAMAADDMATSYADDILTVAVTAPDQAKSVTFMYGLDVKLADVDLDDTGKATLDVYASLNNQKYCIDATVGKINVLLKRADGTTIKTQEQTITPEFHALVVESDSPSLGNVYIDTPGKKLIYDDGNTPHTAKATKLTENCEFLGWYDGTTLISKEETLTSAANGMEYVAKFKATTEPKPAQYTVSIYSDKARTNLVRKVTSSNGEDKTITMNAGEYAWFSYPSAQQNKVAWVTGSTFGTHFGAKDSTYGTYEAVSATTDGVIPTQLESVSTEDYKNSGIITIQIDPKASTKTAYYVVRGDVIIYEGVLSGPSSIGGLANPVIGVGDLIYFDPIDTTLDTDATWKKYFSGNSVIGYTAISQTPSLTGINVTINGNATGVYVGEMPYVTISDFTDYITDGYTAEFKAASSNGAKPVWEVTENGDYVDSRDFDSFSDNKQIVKIKFKDGKLDRGNNSKTIKLRCKINGVYVKIRKSTSSSTSSSSSSSSTTTVDEISITDYSKPKVEYKTDRSIKYTGPGKVSSGNESGGSDSANSTSIATTKGVWVQALHDGSVIGTSKSYTGKGTDFTIESSAVETMVLNLGKENKFSGDKSTVNFRLYAYGTDSNDKADKWNSKIYDETGDLNVYKVVVKVTSSGSTTQTTNTDKVTTTTNSDSKTSGGGVAMNTALPLALISPAGDLVATASTTGTTKEYVFWGLEGQVIDISSIGKASTIKNDSTGDDVASTSKVTVSSDPAKNSYSAVLGTKTPDTGDSEYDKVPKTGQDNAFAFVMIAVVVAAVGGSLYAYNKKAKKNI